MTKSFENELSTLVGLPCWGVVAGVGNGSMATLHVGQRIARQPPLKNPNLPEELRMFNGEFCIFVKGCAWRLENGSRIVCGSTNPEAEIGLKLTPGLTGALITEAQLCNWAGDLNVTFSNQYVLRLFCDQTGEQAIDNYAVRFPSGWIKVGPDGVQSRTTA
jgi:hypothetical protein